MKSRNSINILLLAVFLLWFASCKKYLDKKPDPTQIVPETLRDFQGLLDDRGLMNVSPSFGEALSDNYFWTVATYNGRPVTQQRSYTWRYDDYNYPNDWSAMYLPVYNANLCLDGLEAIPITPLNQVQWNNVKGSALFFRAHSFLHLLWIFSKVYDETSYTTDLGIALRLNSDFNIPSIRSSVKECYERVLIDAKQAVDYLPDNPLHVMRPSKAAAYGLIARTYLSMRKYDSSFRYANLCLGIKNSLLDYNNTSEVAPTASIPFKPLNTEIVFYTEMTTSITHHSTNRGRIDTVLLASYNQDDLRGTAFKFQREVMPFNTYYSFKGSYAADPLLFFTGISTAEMYLTRAECFAREGKLNEALNDLNALMIKRWKSSVPYPTITASNSTEALTKILNERRKELIWRGLRWIDIKRLNKENGNITPTRIVPGNLIFTLSPNDNRYAVPLPLDIILQTGMAQNPQ